MSNAYSELVARISGGEALTRDEAQSLLSTEDGQDFALIEAASALRRQEFRNVIAIHTEDEELAEALGTRSISIDSYEILDISQDIDSHELADRMVALGAGKSTGITVKLPQQAVPMTLMRILSVLRLAAPDKVIHLPEGYEESLRSLASLAMHIVSAITITDDIERWPLVNETLKALRHGGIVIAGSGSRDALAGYLAYLSELGVDLMGHREARGSACGSVDGHGCCGGHESEPAASSGGCGCGSGGCGSDSVSTEQHAHSEGGCCGGHNSAQPVETPKPAASGGCGCGSGGCGSA